MKRIVLLVVAICWIYLTYGQTTIEKNVPVKPGQKVNMDFTWPDLISIKPWDGKEIKIVAKVEINKGQNDDAFTFDTDDSNESLYISSYIKGLKNLPKKIIIYRGDEEHFFNTDDMNDPEIQNFKAKYGDNAYQSMTHGVIKDIEVEIMVPKGIILDVYSKFGLIEIHNYNGQMKIHSKFGGVDISTDGQNVISAGTKFGEKYTNLTSNVKTIALGDRPGRWDWVRIGDQQDNAKQELKSDFGNIYIRKN